jgi:ATP-dependent phosphofructokinase / diphosphate-dependent phosphofructokinase
VKKRIAVITGGGDCPGLNAVLRSLTLALHEANGPELVGLCDAYHGLFQDPPRMLTLTPERVHDILDQGGTILGTANSGDPFSWEGTDRSGELIDLFKTHGLEGLISIGGDGSTAIAHGLAEQGLPVICVPKTIDNDVAGTDVTFGYVSAVACATDALDRLRTTGESHSRVMVLEVMGRDAGWIAMTAGIAGGADVIVLPEMPYNLDAIAAKIAAVRATGRSYALVVVAEGARPDGGTPLYRDPENERLGGVGRVLGRQIEDATGIETRATILGHLQRGGSPSPVDRVLATTFGAAAAYGVITERWGHMVALSNSSLRFVPIEEVVGKTRTIHEGHPLLLTAAALGVCLGR